MPYKSTLKIIALCLGLQIIQSYWPGFLHYQCFIAAAATSIHTLPVFFIGLIVHMFSHGNWPHLIGNMLFGIPCMIFVEKKYGSKVMLEAFVLTGVVGALVQSVMPIGGEELVGASGSISGLLALSCMSFGVTRLERVFGFVVLGLFMVPNLMSLAMGPFSGSGVAHAAHIGGMVCGMMIASYRHLPPQRQP
jgi:membrane associated rhomboid family serine protease